MNLIDIWMSFGKACFKYTSELLRRLHRLHVTLGCFDPAIQPRDSTAFAVRLAVKDTPTSTENR